MAETKAEVKEEFERLFLRAKATEEQILDLRRKLEEKKEKKSSSPQIVNQRSLEAILPRLHELRGICQEITGQEESLAAKNEALRQEVEPLREEIESLEGEMRWIQAQQGKYPEARRGDSVATYENSQGKSVVVSDPYQWLEDPDAPETVTWVKKQGALCKGFLKQCPDRADIQERLESMINYPRYTTPTKKGKYFFYRFNTGLQNQDVLYVHEGSMDNTRQVLIDANTMSEDGTTSLRAAVASRKGELLAYSLKRSGSDWNEFFIKNMETRQDLPESLKWCKFTTPSWTHDAKGFFYSRYAAPAKFVEEKGPEEAKDGKGKEGKEGKAGTETEKLQNQQLCYHRVGTSQEEDVYLVDAKAFGDAELLLGPEVSHDGEWLIVNQWPSCDPVNKVYLIRTGQLDLESKDQSEVLQSQCLRLVDNFDNGFDYITNEGNVFYFTTNQKADNYRIVAADVTDPANVVWKEIVGESKNRLSGATCANGRFLLLNYMEDCQDVMRLVDLEGRPVENNIKFPAAGSIYYSARKEEEIGFFKFTSFLYPGSIYSYNYRSHEMKLVRDIEVAGFDASLFETRQVFFASKDGTKIPMFIMHRKGVSLDGRNPTLLYGYGGFDISLLPSYSSTRLCWLSNFNGVYAIANLRGGGEYGEQWHKAGTKAKKQNVFDDFQAAAEYLIAEGYTCKERLAIEGGSNGGLLVAACCNQRPDLYAAGVAMVGVLDMLKFHKFTIGYAWVSDYGSADEPSEFDALYAYSPLHNIPSQCDEYPSFLATTADHDDRVVPLHSFKFMAELQYRLGAKSQGNPLLIRIDFKAGHSGSSLKKAIELRTDVYAFLSLRLNAPWLKQ